MSDLQRTEEWFADRCGHVTASRFCDVLAVGKTGKPLKARDDYLMRLVIERITGQPAESVDSYAMAWGRDAEPFARAAFEAETALIVTESPFVKHPSISFVGCSPDGLIGKDAGYESKCPKNSAVHLATIRDGMPEEHAAQVQGCMWVTGRSRWHFVSFDPRMPEHLRLYHQVIDRDEKYIQSLELEVIRFLDEVATQLQHFKKAA
jgi:predicted phage-related endonuclease